MRRSDREGGVGWSGRDEGAGRSDREGGVGRSYRGWMKEVYVKFKGFM